MDDAKIDAEMRAQRHLEDKRELKSTIGEKEKQLAEITMKFAESESEMLELKQKLKHEQDEWKRFQDDLLTTVRVANDFKQEAQGNCEKLLALNKSLREKLANYEVSFYLIDLLNIITFCSYSCLFDFS